MSYEAFNEDDDDEIPEIEDLSGGVVGKYYDFYWRSKGFVRLDPDVAAEFADSDSVNRTLRRVVEARRKRRARTRKSSAQAS